MPLLLVSKGPKTPSYIRFLRFNLSVFYCRKIEIELLFGTAQ